MTTKLAWFEREREEAAVKTAAMHIFDLEAMLGSSYAAE